MADRPNRRRTKALREQISRFLSQSRRIPFFPVRILEAVRKNEWEAFLFGGVPRNIWLHGGRSEFRDFDLVFSDASFEAFTRLFEKCIVKRNRFGGIKLRIQSFEVDAWPLSMTWAFSQGFVGDASFANLPKTTPLNVDSIVVELAPRPGRPRRTYENGFFSAFRTRSLDVVLEANPFPELNAVRALKIANQMALGLKRRLVVVISDVLSRVANSELEEVQLQHYKKVVLDSTKLQEIREKIFAAIDDQKIDKVVVTSSANFQPEFNFGDSSSQNAFSTDLNASLFATLASQGCWSGSQDPEEEDT